LPHISVSLHTDITAHILAGLHGGRLDVGFIEGELDDVERDRLEVILWREVPQMVMVGRKHAWWGQPQISLVELDQQAMVMRQPASQTRKWLDEALAGAGVRPLVTAEFDNVESIKRAVILGNCITILPPYAVEQELTLGQLQAIPLANDPLTRQLKLLWPKQGVLSAVAKAFVQQVVGAGREK
jgi:DNA-binding transcriptional LysR family regulator